MKIENVYLRSFVISLIGSIMLFILSLFFGKNVNYSWEITMVYFVLMMLAIIGKHFLKRYDNK
ncbi:hypothetical protein J5Y03_05035 [Bacillus sp. RG28]|uniref:Uncharacterized protein n=1 Tax=Gottfriedia endophytica TaxID=2820819 RepID=A0A940SI26_9BACI|nr:hypothetical protein [Gottfriedia endophytica]MBP0724550.1 hypothetical protein [Gottfriedia endophytica]